VGVANGDQPDRLWHAEGRRDQAADLLASTRSRLTEGFGQIRRPAGEPTCVSLNAIPQQFLCNEISLLEPIRSGRSNAPLCHPGRSRVGIRSIDASAMLLSSLHCNRAAITRRELLTARANGSVRAALSPPALAPYSKTAHDLAKSAIIR